MSAQRTITTQVAIIGAGPAGLILSHLLHLHGIESVVLEARSQQYVEARLRAGVLDHDVSRLFRAVGVGERMDREGLVQTKMEFRFDGTARVMDWGRLSGGRSNVVYGQQEVVRDFIAQIRANGTPLNFDSPVSAITEIHDDGATLVCTSNDEEFEIRSRFVAGCDGFHGIARASIPATEIELFERTYPFVWIGILAEATPAREWLVSASSDRGYALSSMRSRTRSRHYIQVSPTDRLEEWPDERVWDELELRLALDEPDWKLERGPIIDKSRVELRSFVCEPMRYRSMFLLGDAAHVVPPTGGRGLNQAVADACILADALQRYFAESDERGIDSYSEDCLRRVWHAQHFTWRMTNMMQIHDYSDRYQRRLQLTEMRNCLVDNTPAATVLAEHYTGYPLRSSFLPNA